MGQCSYANGEAHQGGEDWEVKLVLVVPRRGGEGWEVELVLEGKEVYCVDFE